jgi:hypothetical protein
MQQPPVYVKVNFMILDLINSLKLEQELSTQIFQIRENLRG